MSKPELEFHLPNEPWVGAGDGIAEQTLAVDQESGARSALVRWAPGTDTSPAGSSRHDYWEEVFLLEGELTDLALGTTFPAGHYACRPPGMPHGPWITRPGVTMLVFTYPDVAPQAKQPTKMVHEAALGRETTEHPDHGPEEEPSGRPPRR